MNADRKYIMKKVFISIISLTALFFASCGDPDVSITSSGYEPKIVVEAYLFAGQTVQNIKITRNYALGQQIDIAKIILTPSGNAVTVTINGIPLHYDGSSGTYYNNAISVEYGKTYVLEISATVDGKVLHAKSTTTVPRQGFKVLSSHDLGNLRYGIDPVSIQYTPSEGASFYVFAFMADTVSVQNYIFDNPYQERPDTADVLKDIDNFQVHYDCLMNLSSGANVYTYNFEYFRVQFYSSYETIVYAGDANFKNYLLTNPSVQEMDGNFHEPIPVLQGDGIGVFGSAIKDTVLFRIVR